MVNAQIRRGIGIRAMDRYQRDRHRGAHIVLALMIWFAMGFLAGSMCMWRAMTLPAIPGNDKGINLPNAPYLSPPQGDAVVTSDAPIASWSRGIHTPAVNDDIVYGHVHIAKTAGSEINGLLATRYERVCGNKGNSYDYYQTNARYEEARKRNCTTAWGCIQDAATLSGEHLGDNRGRLSRRWMDEVGYEDCDYISMEHKGTLFWEKEFMELGGPALKKELHIPCRADPVDHLLSKCNHGERRILCSRFRRTTTTQTEEMIKQLIKSCGANEGRFNNRLLDLRPAVAVKCFTAIPVEPYMQYMSDKLQTRRIQFNYVHRDTGPRVRNKANECLWQDPALWAKIKEVLVREVNYFSFCQQCLGSEEDLLHEGG
mmetsp:Transcript_5694/g.12408  ORF Transcript_5694/g.12408 Transcript_5694/m.12408 type:complete len:372 (-) Transcript_5694:501-1616(-)